MCDTAPKQPDNACKVRMRGGTPAVFAEVETGSATLTSGRSRSIGDIIRSDLPWLVREDRGAQLLALDATICGCFDCGAVLRWDWSPFVYPLPDNGGVLYADGASKGGLPSYHFHCVLNWCACHGVTLALLALRVNSFACRK
jgi:hypothetical protein